MSGTARRISPDDAALAFVEHDDWLPASVVLSFQDGKWCLNGLAAHLIHRFDVPPIKEAIFAKAKALYGKPYVTGFTHGWEGGNQNPLDNTYRVPAYGLERYVEGFRAGQDARSAATELFA